MYQLIYNFERIIVPESLRDRKIQVRVKSRTSTPIHVTWFTLKYFHDTSFVKKLSISMNI